MTISPAGGRGPGDGQAVLLAPPPQCRPRAPRCSAHLPPAGVPPPCHALSPAAAARRLGTRSLLAASSAAPPGKARGKQHRSPDPHRPSLTRCSADLAGAPPRSRGPGKHAEPGRSGSASRQTSLAQACRPHARATVPTSSEPSAAGLWPCPTRSRAARPLGARVTPRSWWAVRTTGE